MTEEGELEAFLYFLEWCPEAPLYITLAFYVCALQSPYRDCSCQHLTDSRFFLCYHRSKRGIVPPGLSDTQKLKTAMRLGSPNFVRVSSQYLTALKSAKNCYLTQQVE